MAQNSTRPDQGKPTTPAAARPATKARSEAQLGRAVPGTGAPDTTARPEIAQAKRDLDAGQVDTDMHATPGLDAQRREALVPGAGGKSIKPARPAR